MNELIAMYGEGAITGYHLMLQSLHMVDPQDPSLVLAFLPAEVIDEMVEYIRRYRPEGMFSKPGLPPAVDQVESARIWIDRKRAKQSKSKEESCPA